MKTWATRGGWALQRVWQALCNFVTFHKKRSTIITSKAASET
jgi:hypothetical protein